ncbi:MAG: hypothetical protein V4660_20700 [Pseudomonadota bacterium]
MLLKHLYIMSLEYPGPGCALWFGGEKLGDLRCYISGFRSGMSFANLSTDDDEAFFNWLKSNGYFPCGGWQQIIVDKTGDGEPAYLKFFEILNKYLFEQRPNWLLEFNREPQPSPCGETRSKDIRNLEHVKMLRELA